MKNKKIPQFWDKGVMLVDGCSRVSPGCKNCWSEKMTARFNRVPEVLTSGGYWNGKVQFNLHLLEKAAKGRKPQVIAIWNDLYHKGVTAAQRMDALRVMADNRQHVFLIVTKRIEDAAIFWSEFLTAAANASIKNAPETHPVHEVPIGFRGSDFAHGAMMKELWPHIWHIVTCENQAMADERIPHLLEIPGKRGIIIEPMLEAMVLNWSGTLEHNGKQLPIECEFNPLSHLHQVILGPENGPGKRPFDPAWDESVKAQCEAAGVPFYRKDTGEGTLAWRTE